MSFVNFIREVKKMRVRFYYVMGLVLLFMDVLSAKVMVITHSYNRPDFIRLQHDTLKKFLLDEYEFVVFNDGPTTKLAHQIEEACRELSIRCIRIPQEIHQMAYLPRQPWEDWNSPSIRTANALQYSFNAYAFNYDGIVAVMDSDMFLIRPFSIEEYLKGYDISAVKQWRGSLGYIHYIWNGLMFFNMNTVPNKRSLNFNSGSIYGNHTDTGGFTYFYLTENPKAKVLYMKEQLDLTDGDCITDSYDLENRGYLLKDQVLEMVSNDDALMRFVQAEPDDVQFFLHFAFLHYRRGGNYHNKSHIYHQEKTRLLDRFIEEILFIPNRHTDLKK
jgi:glycosyltransferase involved in cell wall biosynthesis